MRAASLFHDRTGALPVFLRTRKGARAGQGRIAASRLMTVLAGLTALICLCQGIARLVPGGHTTIRIDGIHNGRSE
ncbi:MAG: hypothetical protein SWN98_08265 [Pseudomonadota bacterium]|nr:hypothetical protein [Pseudomonadota bacterium]